MVTVLVKEPSLLMFYPASIHPIEKSPTHLGSINRFLSKKYIFAGLFI